MASDKCVIFTILKSSFCQLNQFGCSGRYFGMPAKKIQIKVNNDVCLQMTAFIGYGICFIHYFPTHCFPLLKRGLSRVCHIPKIFSDFYTNNTARRFDQKIGALIRANIPTGEHGKILSEFLKVKLFDCFVHTS